MIHPKSLQQRLTLFLILPVAFLLILMGIAGFIYSRNFLLSQWREASVLKLQRATHQVDMRLARVKNWIRIFHQTSSSRETDELHDLVIAQLKQQEGVDQVQLIWNKDQAPLTAPNRTRMSPMGHMNMTAGRPMMMRRYHSARIREITPPRFNDSINHETVSLISDLNDENGQSIGRLEVVLDFDVLIKNVRESGWWQSNKAFLVSVGGKILTSTVSEKRDSLADSGNPLEQETVKAMQTNAYGTILGEEHPPKEVSGFYKLQEAPWYLVMIAPGNAILAPIVRFRFHYLATGAGFILLIVILIRVVTGRTVVSIREVSSAAERVANGDYEGLLPVKARDEVGELTRSFNAMVQQLKDRMEMKQAMSLAMEVQQNLLPKNMPLVKGLDIAARSIYCDETGGDLYDFLEIDDCNADCIGIAVGDVSGHGIPAALLMATVRAFLKSRVTQPGSTAEIISDVNRLVTHDTGETGQFMTLFYAEIDPRERTIDWVRAGHDPAMLYTPDADTIEELRGKGTALGVDGDSEYPGQIIKGLSQGQVLLIGTDGLWETRNESGEMFGKERLEALIRRYAHLSSKQMITSIIDALQAFRKSVKQDDDITLVVIKVDKLGL
jgi:sigma-B regulation protein RsbU (phosphoserine phosphatase)